MHTRPIVVAALSLVGLCAGCGRSQPAPSTPATAVAPTPSSTASTPPAGQDTSVKVEIVQHNEDGEVAGKYTITTGGTTAVLDGSPAGETRISNDGIKAGNIEIRRDSKTGTIEIRKDGNVLLSGAITVDDEKVSDEGPQTPDSP